MLRDCNEDWTEGTTPLARDWEGGACHGDWPASCRAPQCAVVTCSGMEVYRVACESRNTRV